MLFRSAGHLACSLLLALPAALLAGPLEDGDAAYRRGDHAAALNLWLPLARQGVARAQASVALLYRNGQGVARDEGESIRWLRLAAEQGDAEAQTNLGMALGQGLGTHPDAMEAVHWYRLAAAQQFAIAQNALGSSYAAGHGVRQSFADALNWYRLAA